MWPPSLCQYLHALFVATSDWCLFQCSVCVVSVIVKRPVLPPSAVDGRSRNPLYYYYYCNRVHCVCPGP